MALNGLDTPPLQEALKDAQAHADAWLFLKYISRDEVDILAKGHGGLPEAKDALASYTDLSPLYGFLSYRERKILLKYIPDGTSRLLQARTTVHFQDFSDAFDSHNAILAIKTADDLDDVTLSEACSLPIPGSVEATRDVIAELKETKRVSTSTSPSADPAPIVEKAPSHVEQIPETVPTQEALAAERQPPSESAPTDDSAVADRPSTSESVRKILATWEPEEEKHYTRPAVENKAVRPADQSRATLPAGMKAHTPRKSEVERPRSSRSQRSVTSRSAERPNISQFPVPPLPDNDRSRTGAPGSAKSAAAASQAPISVKTTGSDRAKQSEIENLEAFNATGWIPQSEATNEEKARLMRALEQRKKHALTASKPKATEMRETIVSVPASNGTPKATPLAADSTSQANHKVVTSYDRLEEMVTANAAGKDESHEPKEATSNGENEVDSLKVKRQRPGSEHLRIDVNAGQSEQGSVTDDSLLDELQNAQVERATPISLAAGPMSPNLENTASRQVSNMSVNPITVRSGSGSHNTSPNQHLNRTRTASHISKASTDTVSLARVGTVSKGISARIQALAEHSSREPSPNSQHRDLLSVGNLPARPSSRGSIASKGGSRSTSPSRSAAARAPRKWTVNPSATSINNIAEPRAQSSHSFGVAKGLYRPFTTQQTVAPVVPSTARQTYSRSERPMSPAARPESRESNMTAVSKKSTESGWRFFSRRKADGARSPENTMKSMSSTSLEKVSEDAVEEKTSRAGRLLKRMSGLSAGSKAKDPSDRASRSSKNGKSPTAPASAVVPNPAAFTMGDLNVQFPDSLLWKRRWVEVDGAGGIVLAAVRGNENPPRGSSRRYKLAEFRAPIIPAHDRQELSNSIMLDLESGGGTLQLAFQDAVGQQHFLRRLLESNGNWRSH